MRCHTVDPSLIALKESQLEQPCVTRLAIGDIGDRQYRNCFESTHVEERLSFFSRLDADLRQISIYGGARKRNVSAVELKHYSALASLVLATAFKHEIVFANRTDQYTSSRG